MPEAEGWGGQSVRRSLHRRLSSSLFVLHRTLVQRRLDACGPRSLGFTGGYRDGEDGRGESEGDVDGGRL